jgi:predicted RNA binding protein YcfA (HicA-like mRNA interferase family)
VSLLKKYGFVLRTTKTGGKGSHDVFKHPDHPEVQSLTIPRHNKLKSCYVKKAVETIDIMENDEEEIEEEIEETEEKPEEENEEPRT